MNIAVAHSPDKPAHGPPAIRVMIVDDSSAVRSLLARWIEDEPDLEVVASLPNGVAAVENLVRVDPDVVILDIEMPELDGISALPILLGMKHDLVVIMASALTRRHAEVSIRALTLGAADYVPKPETSRDAGAASDFRRELIEKIRQLVSRRRRDPAGRRAPAPPAPDRASPPAHILPAHILPAHVLPAHVLPAAPLAPKISLRPFPTLIPRILLIGASTGGPQALTTLLGQLGDVIDHAPVLVVQHMPPTFTTIFAEHLTRATGRPVREGVDGQPVRAGQVYLAPGGAHMRVERRGGIAVLTIDDAPPVNFCKPSLDPLFTSAAKVWGAWAMALVLTGMGADGAGGAADIVAAGGGLIAQDESSSVVWGMPGAVAMAGLCSAVLPLDQIAARVIRVFAGSQA